MEPFDLPPELAEMERRLAERRQPVPSASFRQRVLLAMQSERTPRRSFWNAAAVLAASVLLGLNLGLSVANRRAWSQAERIDNADIETAVRSLRQRHPDLSIWEAHQFAVLMQSPPELAVSLPVHLAWEGEESWDMR